MEVCALLSAILVIFLLKTQSLEGICLCHFGFANNDFFSYHVAILENKICMCSVYTTFQQSLPEIE